VELAAAALTDAEGSFQAAGRGQGFEPTLNVLRAQLAWVRGEGERARELFATSLQALESSPPSYLVAEGLGWLREQFRKSESEEP
jgi:hypothetical protein